MSAAPVTDGVISVRPTATPYTVEVPVAAVRTAVPVAEARADPVPVTRDAAVPATPVLIRVLRYSAMTRLPRGRGLKNRCVPPSAGRQPRATKGTKGPSLPDCQLLDTPRPVRDTLKTWSAPFTARIADGMSSRSPPSETNAENDEPLCVAHRMVPSALMPKTRSNPVESLIAVGLPQKSPPSETNALSGPPTVDCDAICMTPSSSMKNT